MSCSVDSNLPDLQKRRDRSDEGAVRARRLLFWSVPVARWAWHLSGMGMKALEQRRLISKAMRLTVQGSSETLKVWRRGVGNRDTQP
jgi:hypothetical protein